jgi:hypothetical protein
MRSWSRPPFARSFASRPARGRPWPHDQGWCCGSFGALCDCLSGQMPRNPARRWRAGQVPEGRRDSTIALNNSRPRSTAAWLPNMGMFGSVGASGQGGWVDLVSSHLALPFASIALTDYRSVPFRARVGVPTRSRGTERGRCAETDLSEWVDGSSDCRNPRRVSGVRS